jgi:hypothetical protein
MQALHIELDDFSRFVEAYADCALWCLKDENDEPCDLNNLSDLSPELKDQILNDCWGFWLESWSLICRQHCRTRLDPAEQAGHDFWLTRNGHGAGFWDGNWTQEIGATLTTRAKVYGTSDWYFGDDGRIYA